jgi:hypothetical protein
LWQKLQTVQSYNVTAVLNDIKDVQQAYNTKTTEKYHSYAQDIKYSPQLLITGLKNTLTT